MRYINVLSMKTAYFYIFFLDESRLVEKKLMTTQKHTSICYVRHFDVVFGQCHLKSDFGHRFMF